MSFPYLINDVVLARVPNGRIYYTKIRSISLARKECVTEFDDGSIATVDWTNIFDVAAETDVIVCVVCKQGESEPPNEIILCDTCNVGYHQKCHIKKITSQQIAQDKWHCHYCLTKGKNPHVINPFENSRTRSPSKRKRKLRKVEPKPKPKPRKRRKLQRTPPKPSKTTKSYVAKKCTVSIVKKSITKVQSLAPEPSSDGSSCSSEEAEPVSLNSPETRTDSRSITPPVSLPLPHRPVNAVQPLNHSMVYPACTPPPLQMSPLIKKTPRVISCSPPPLITPRDVTTNRDVLMSMSSLPPLQKARVSDCDPLRDASKASVSPFEKTGTTAQSSQPTKSPVEDTQPVQPSVITNEVPKSSASIETSESIPEPSVSQLPPGPSATGSVSGISSEQIRGLYMRLYDFLQQTRAQGNPVIDRDVVQHLISYGNEQIQRLSTTSVSSDSEQMESTNTLTERCHDSSNPVEINNCTSTLSSDREVESMPPDQIQQFGPKRANQVAAEKFTESPAKLDDRIRGLEDIAKSSRNSADQTEFGTSKSSFMGEADCVSLPPDLNRELCEVSKASSTAPATTEKTAELHNSVVEKQSNLTENLSVGTVDLSPAVNSKTFPLQESKSGLSTTPIMTDSAKKSRSIVENPSHSSGDLPKAVSKPTLSTKPIQVVSSSSTIPKSGIKKMVCQPLPPASSEICVGQHVQRKFKSSKSKTLKGPANKKSSSKPRSVTVPRKRKTEENKCSNSAPGNKSTTESFSESTYTAVQAGNSVIIKPNCGNDIPTENSVPVQFLSGQSAALQTKSSNQLSMICQEYSVDEELRAGEKEKSSVLHTSAQSNSTSLPLESPKICTPAIPNSSFTDSGSSGNCPPSSSSVPDTISTFPTTNSEPAASVVSFPPPSAKSDVLYKNSGSRQEANNLAKTLHSFEQESKTKTSISSATLNTNSKGKESLEKSAPMSCAEQSVTTPTQSTTDTISTKPQLRSNSSSPSDTKKTCPSNRSTLTRGSKIQAKNNIKSFTIFDSYSSLFDSDDDDEVYVSQKPVSQVSSEPPKRFPGYNQTSAPTSTQHMNSTQDSNYVSSAPVERSSSDQMSAPTAETPSVAAVFSLDDLIDIQEDNPIQVSSTDIPSTSTSAALLNPLDSYQPDNTIATPFQSEKDSSELFTSASTFSPSLTSPPFDFEQFQRDTQTPDVREVESPAESLDVPSTGQKDQPIVATAQHISRMFHQMLLMASAKCASEIAVRATVIKLREDRVSRNVLTATLLHSLLSAASKNTIRPISPQQTANHRPATPATISLKPTSFPTIISHSQNQSTFPITTTYQSRPITPLATGQNPDSVVVSQSMCPVSLSDTASLEVNTSNLRGAPSPNETRSGTAVETPASSSLNNDQNNKNGITGQCYNCYSPALIACRKCSDALYCSLRCELEHLAIHRRECCKRQS